jgi:hypothetical protein
LLEYLDFTETTFHVNHNYSFANPSLFYHLKQVTNVKKTNKVFYLTHRYQSIANRQTSILVSGTTFNYLCHEYTIIASYVLIAYAACNTESQT